ncbi:MAG: MerC domain-containing protein [Candidatus Latescibacteria bacterium]|nr:MerC domain-containing protein [Candidatus Latescibacterota bacterium]
MYVFLALSVIGLSRSCARHRKPYPLVLGVLSAIGLLTGILFLSQTPFAYVSLAGLIGASVWDLMTKRSCAVG